VSLCGGSRKIIIDKATGQAGESIEAVSFDFALLKLTNHIRFKLYP